MWKLNMSEAEYLNVGGPGTIWKTKTKLLETWKYKYLGNLISQDGKDDQGIEHRIKQGKTIMQQLNGI